jgi:hypothetical protein
VAAVEELHHRGNTGDVTTMCVLDGRTSMFGSQQPELEDLR